MARYSARYGRCAIFAAAVLGYLLISLKYADPYAGTWDEVDFALALDRFDLLAMQPHFPGYPYFILGGMAVHAFVDNPAQALAVFNIAMSVASLIPIVLIARRFADPLRALLFSAVVLTSPYLWMLAGSAMSEPAALAMLWWYLWSFLPALERERPRLFNVLPMFFFGLLMGIRLSFFPFGTALLILWVIQFIRSSSGVKVRWFSLIGKLSLALLFQLIWITGLVLSEGGPTGFTRLMFAFIKGHFSEWGGGVGASNMAFGTRVVTFLTDNLLWTSLAGQSAAVGVMLLVFAATAAIGRIEYPSRAKTAGSLWVRLLLVSLGAYTLWALLGQNIDKPRHIAPVVGPLLLLACFRTIGGTRPKAARMSISACVLLLCLQAAHGTELLNMQSENKPATYQLHEFLNGLEGNFIVYTWEETRVLDYLGAEYPHKQILTYKWFEAESAEEPDRRIYMTDHVLRGFEKQAGDLRARVKPVALFDSFELADPVYHRIRLYEWLPE